MNAETMKKNLCHCRLGMIVTRHKSSYKNELEEAKEILYKISIFYSKLWLMVSAQQAYLMSWVYDDGYEILSNFFSSTYRNSWIVGFKC